MRRLHTCGARSPRSARRGRQVALAAKFTAGSSGWAVKVPAMDASHTDPAPCTCRVLSPATLRSGTLGFAMLGSRAATVRVAAAWLRMRLANPRSMRRTHRRECRVRRSPFLERPIEGRLRAMRRPTSARGVRDATAQRCQLRCRAIAGYQPPATPPRRAWDKPRGPATNVPMDPDRDFPLTSASANCIFSAPR